MQALKSSRQPADAADSERMTDLPDLVKLKEEFDWSVQHRDSNLPARLKLNRDARYCQWEGQTVDGKRWYVRAGENEVFPWLGASDVRAPVIDTLIREDVALLMGAWRRMRLTVQGVESGDIEWSTRATQLLRWMKYTQMVEAPREARLLANTLLERGSAVMAVLWCREETLARVKLTLEELRQVSVLATQAMARGVNDPETAGAAQALSLVLDPSAEAEAGELLGRRLPHLTAARARRVARDLRESGVAEFPVPQITKDRPTLVALVPNQDVFIAPDEVDMDNLRMVDRVETLSEAGLRSRVRTHDWDEAWVEEVIERGRGNAAAPVETYRPNPLLADPESRMFQIVHSYRRRFDGEGVPVVQVTVWHPDVKELAASHDTLDYQHGKLPFVVFELEKIARHPDASRGYGEVLGTLQNQIKGEMDARIDRASIATVPPMFHPPGLAPSRWGPGVKVGAMRRDEYGFMDPPRPDAGSKEVEETVRKLVDAYVGRPVDEQNVALAQAMQQDKIDVWMEGWREVDTQILQLCQQYLPDEISFRVVGSDKARPIHATLKEIQGQFDLTLTYNVRALDMDYIQSVLGVMKEAIAFDRGGMVDWTQALKVVFDLVDPNLGERLLEPGDTAAEREITDEKAAWASIMQGIDMDVRPDGQNHQLRLQVAQQMMAQNPTAQKRLSEDEHVRKLAEKRVKQLAFQVEQKGRNAQIGRMGA